MLKFLRKRSGSQAQDGGGKPLSTSPNSPGALESSSAPLIMLKEALEANNVSQVKKLSSQSPMVLNAPLDDLGATCLHLAAVMGNLECLEIMLKYGDVNVVDSVGHTVLHSAVDHPEVLSMLLKKKNVDVNRLAFNRQSLLHIMARKFSPVDDEIWALLKKRNPTYTIVNVSGDTPLHVCCQTGHTALAQYLLSTPGLNVNLQNKKEETPLLIAAERDHLPLVQLLLAAGASPHLPDISGRTPLDVSSSTDVESAIREAVKSLKASAGSSTGRDSPLKSSSSSSLGITRQNSSSSLSHQRLFHPGKDFSVAAGGPSNGGAAPSPPLSPVISRASPQNFPNDGYSLSSSAPNGLMMSRERSGSFSSFAQASHRLILMDEELHYSASSPDLDESSQPMEQHHFIVERLGTELVEELRHLLDDAFILDALTKITSSKSFKWHSNYTRTKVEVLKWMADFVGEEENQGYLRHLKVKYPEVIKLTFVRTTSAKKLSKKEKSQKKLTLVERKIKAFDWELLPDQLAFGEIIGTGSFGAVYHATLYPGGEEVAVKMLTEDVGFEDSATFMKEIAILSRLFHPAIVGFIGASITGSLYLVMEYCSEGNLKTYLQSHSAVTTWRMKMKLARQTAEGIEYLHQQSPPIVHRDLKCQNILVTCDGDAKVSDFGLSKTLSRTIGNASKMGTLNWLAPEVLRGEAHHSTAADVYAFGMVLYEILMDGTPPYDSWQPLQIVRAIDEGLQPEIPPTCDPLYKELMEDCWSLNPASRPKFSEICSRLRAIERLTFAHKSQCSSGDSTPTASPRSGSASLLMSSSPKKRILAAPSASSDHPVRAGSSSSCLASTEEPRASSLKLGRKQHKGSPEHF